MDLSPFSEENFDVKTWVNNILRSPDVQEDKDHYAASLVMKLQLFIQEINNSLEETSQQVLSSLPRVVRDAETLRQEAALLQEQMRTVKKDIEKVEKDTAASMETLVEIDRVKTRMQDASEALKEADNWTTLSSDVEDVFESGDVSAIAKKLVGMQQSLKILTHVSDYEERKQNLEGLKNRLEALASPHLVSAFNSRSLENSQLYVGIFTSIHRLPQLIKYFHKCQKGSLIQRWRNIVETEQDDGVLVWMNKFYDFLIINWHEQLKWCCQVFPTSSPVSLMVRLYADVLQGLDPSIDFCIEAALKQETQHLELLINCKQNTDRFTKSLETAITSAQDSNVVTSEDLVKLATSLYFPYSQFVARYEQYEENIFIDWLESGIELRDDVADSIHLLGQLVLKITTKVTEANQRCSKFSGGCSFIALLKALKTFYIHLIDRFHSLIQQLNEQRNSSDTWVLVQGSLNLLQIVGDLLLQTEQTNNLLVSSFVELTRKYWSSGEADDGGLCQKLHLVFLDEAEQVELRSVAKYIQGGHDPAIISEISQLLHDLGEEIQQVMYDLMFAPISTLLSLVPSLEIWEEKVTGGTITSDLPAFSFSPQEYITQVGQYLMVLPQQLEPFLVPDNTSLSRALRSGVVFSTSQRLDPDTSTIDCLLGSLADGTCQNYAENILKIPEVTDGSIKQLIADIEYLSNILDDLGLHLSSTLQSLLKLLHFPVAEFWTMSAGQPPRLIAAVRQMRNITPRS